MTDLTTCKPSAGNPCAIKPCNPDVGALAAMLIAWLGVCVTAQAQDATPPARYSIKQEAPSVGTSIPRNLAVGSMPFKKTYAQLTPEQQARLKAQYEQMGEGDEPPYPLNGTHALYKALSDAQQKLNLTGDLLMLAEIDSQGQATSVAVVQSPGPQMTQVAATALILEKYKPAQCAGVACKMQFPLVVSFRK
jgi:hypothetical protein